MGKQVHGHQKNYKETYCMEACRDYLKTFPHYTPELFEQVLPFLSEKEIKAGDYFLREGKVCTNIGIIERGLLRLYYLNDGKEITNCFCKENNLVTAYSSLITGQPSELAIQAIEDAKLIILPYHALQKLYDKNLFWQQVGRMASESEYITTECHTRFLRDLSATERYLQILEQEPDLLQRVPLNYLATYIQVTPETLSRIRKKIGRN